MLIAGSVFHPAFPRILLEAKESGELIYTYSNSIKELTPNVIFCNKSALKNF